MADKDITQFLNSPSCPNKISITTERCPDCSHPVEYENSQPVCRNDNCATQIIPYEK